MSNFYIWTSSLNGLRFELFSQEVAHKLIHYGRRDLLHVTNILGAGRHVQDCEQRCCFWEVRVVPQGISHVILQWRGEKITVIYVILHHVNVTAVHRLHAWMDLLPHREQAQTSFSCDVQKWECLYQEIWAFSLFLKESAEFLHTVSYVY